MPARLLGTFLALAAALLAPTSATAQPTGFDLQAHAGGRGETTGESLRAFARSLEIGVTTLEFDIAITEDGQPLVWHDPVVEAAQCSDTGPAFAGDPAYPYVGKLVHELTLPQIRTLDCGKPNSEFPRAEVLWGNKLATLADHPGMSAGPQEFVDVVLAAVRSAGMVDRVEIQSFDWRTLTIARRAEPSIPLVALWNERTWVPESPWLADVDPVLIGDPMLGAMMVGASVLSPRYPLVTGRSFIDRAHSLGLKVIPWTVNDADAMRELIAAGVDGIITDYPTLLRNVLAAAVVTSDR